MSLKLFWNEEKIVKYFYDKPADLRIVKRLKQISNRSNKNALDLGCGGGRHTQLLLELGFNTYACDVNQAMINQTKKRVSNLKNYNLNNIVKGSILDTPFPNNFFDVVVTTGVLHQAKSLKEYRQATKELSRVLKQSSVITLNIFTNKVWNSSYIRVPNEKYTIITKEGLYMTLLSKELFYELMTKEDLILEKELDEEIKLENTGERAVLRANFIKK